MRAALQRLQKALRGKPRSFALNELDLKLRSYLNFRNGFFVEAGANDGIAQSNTLYFERSLGWRGLLIEPIPETRISKEPEWTFLSRSN